MHNEYDEKKKLLHVRIMKCATDVCTIYGSIIKSILFVRVVLVVLVVMVILHGISSNTTDAVHFVILT